MQKIYKYLDCLSPLWGICSFDDFSEHLIQCRALSRIPADTKSIIVALFPYYLGEDAYCDSNISRYAVVPDYNDYMLERLENTAKVLREIYPDEKFEAFCGNSPFPEVSLAEKAGIGSKGVNGLLLTEKYGSWVFIGEIATTLNLTPTHGRINLCNDCNLCIDACPSGALSRDKFNSELCLSSITQQRKPLTKEQEELIKSTGCAWGCDICQKVCPKNIGASITEIEEFVNGVKFRAEIGDDLTDRAYGWRGSKVIERNLNLFNEKE